MLKCFHKNSGHITRRHQQRTVSDMIMHSGRDVAQMNNQQILRCNQHNLDI